MCEKTANWGFGDKQINKNTSLTEKPRNTRYYCLTEKPHFSIVRHIDNITNNQTIETNVCSGLNVSELLYMY